MGAQIAAHLANAGVPTLLLDIAPRELTPEEQAKGLTLESKEVRNRIARAGLEAAKKAKPAAFFTPDNASLVTVGNFDDDLAKLKDCDLIIEAVVENLEIKRSLYERVEQHRRPGSIVASNTSGIPIRHARRRSLGRFQSTLSRRPLFQSAALPASRRTDSHRMDQAGSLVLPVSAFSISDWAKASCRRRTVRTSSPIASARSARWSRSRRCSRTVTRSKKSTRSPDQAVGRPKSATFRTFDLVGLDVFAHVIKNLYEALPEDEEREMFVAPEFLTKMVGRGLLGNKTKGGFYKKTEGRRRTSRRSGRSITATLEYRPSQKVKLPSLDMAKNIEDMPERIKALVWGKDRVGAFLWKTMSRTFRYAANRIPEIADTVVEVDRAMRWGFSWELGPFEVWDAIGVEKSVARMKEEGQAVPANVQKMLDAGAKSFYKKQDGQQFYFDFASEQYRAAR